MDMVLPLLWLSSFAWSYCKVVVTGACQSAFPFVDLSFPPHFSLIPLLGFLLLIISLQTAWKSHNGRKKPCACGGGAGGQGGVTVAQTWHWAFWLWTITDLSYVRLLESSEAELMCGGVRIRFNLWIEIWSVFPREWNAYSPFLSTQFTRRSIQDQ